MEIRGTVSPPAELHGKIRTETLTGSLAAVADKNRLHGVLSPTYRLYGVITGQETLSGAVTSSGNYDSYKGSYVVDPKAHRETVLQTKNKFMSENVTVNQIRMAQVSNPSGGMTVYIAEDE